MWRDCCNDGLQLQKVWKVDLGFCVDKQHRNDVCDGVCNQRTEARVGVVNSVSVQKFPLDKYRAYPYSSPDSCHRQHKSANIWEDLPCWQKFNLAGITKSFDTCTQSCSRFSFAFLSFGGHALPLQENRKWKMNIHKGDKHYLHCKLYIWHHALHILSSRAPGQR